MLGEDIKRERERCNLYLHRARERVYDLVCLNVVVDEDLVAVLGAEFEWNSDGSLDTASGFANGGFDYSCCHCDAW